MKLILKLKAQLEAVGASLDEQTMDYSLHCDAPSGYVWRANGETSFSIHYATNRETWLSKALAEEMPSLKIGLEKVTDAARIAEIQHMHDDDSWGAPADAPDFIAFPAA